MTRAGDLVLRWVPASAGAAAMLVAVVLWATGSLGAKAEESDLRAVETRVGLVERQATGLTKDVAWIKRAVWAISQHYNIAIEPPP